MRFTKFAGTALLFVAVAILAGCGAMTAQNTGTTYKPANASPDAKSDALMLKGYDVVSYFVDNKDAMGSAQFRTNYQGITFQFTSGEHKALFDKDPTRYLPEFGGYCANGIVYGIPWGGDGDSWKMIDGKLYIFGGHGSKDAFLLEEASNVTLAKKYWAEEVQGSNSIAQRTKRLVFKVPHYKSGEELAKAVAASKVKR